MADAFYLPSTVIKSFIVIWPLVVAAITLRCHLLSLSRHGW
jgi:hypothetical protein